MLPRIEAPGYVINHDGQTRGFVAVVGLHFVSTGHDAVKLPAPTFPGASPP